MSRALFLRKESLKLNGAPLLSCDSHFGLPRDFQEMIEAGRGRYPHLHRESHWHPISLAPPHHMHVCMQGIYIQLPTVSFGGSSGLEMKNGVL
jgi:hypothetical protein